MRQVKNNDQLTKLNFPRLRTIGAQFQVYARALARARLVAPAAARIAPSLPYCR